MTDEHALSDAALAARYGVPVELVERAALSDEQRRQVVGLRLSGDSERDRMPRGTLVATLAQADGTATSAAFVSGRPTREDPTWQGEAIPARGRRFRNLRDPRDAAGAHVALRVRVRCPHCGAIVAELHEFEHGALFHTVQEPERWGVVSLERGEVGAWCRACTRAGDAVDVHVEKIAGAWRRSEAEQRVVTVNTGSRAGSTR